MCEDEKLPGRSQGLAHKRTCLKQGRTWRLTAEVGLWPPHRHCGTQGPAPLGRTCFRKRTVMGTWVPLCLSHYPGTISPTGFYCKSYQLSDNTNGLWHGELTIVVATCTGPVCDQTVMIHALNSSRQEGEVKGSLTQDYTARLRLKKRMEPSEQLGKGNCPLLRMWPLAGWPDIHAHLVSAKWI